MHLNTVTVILNFMHQYQTVYMFLANLHVSGVRWVSSNSC